MEYQVYRPIAFLQPSARRLSQPEPRCYSRAQIEVFMQKSISAQSPSWAGVVGNEAGRCLFDRLAPPVRGQSPACQREFAVARWRMATLGDQDVFLRPRLSARYRFSQGTLAGTRATGETRRWTKPLSR